MKGRSLLILALMVGLLSSFAYAAKTKPAPNPKAVQYQQAKDTAQRMAAANAMALHKMKVTSSNMSTAMKYAKGIATSIDTANKNLGLLVGVMTADQKTKTMKKVADMRSQHSMAMDAQKMLVTELGKKKPSPKVLEDQTEKATNSMKKAIADEEDVHEMMGLPKKK